MKRMTIKDAKEVICRLQQSFECDSEQWKLAGDIQLLIEYVEYLEVRNIEISNALDYYAHPKVWLMPE
jgi:hypothetical protein